jgi:hypothetical protein
MVGMTDTKKDTDVLDKKDDDKDAPTKRDAAKKAASKDGVDEQAATPGGPATETPQGPLPSLTTPCTLTALQEWLKTVSYLKASKVINLTTTATSITAA